MRNFGVHHAEQAGERADRLRGPQHEEPARIQGVVESRDDPLLEHRGEVDQHVAATDQVQVGEGRVRRHVLLGEDAHISDRLADPIGFLLFVKKRRSRSGDTSASMFSG